MNAVTGVAMDQGSGALCAAHWSRIRGARGLTFYAIKPHTVPCSVCKQIRKDRKEMANG